MPWSLLEDCSKEMAEQVYGADDLTKRAIALAACRWTVDHLLPDDAVVRSALTALERGDYGDDRLLASLQDHVDQLDLRYFDAQEARQDYQPLFAKARVAGAVHAALGADPFRAVTRCLYELCAAVGSEPVQTQVDRVLS
jgi:hypothetical protein